MSKCIICGTELSNEPLLKLCDAPASHVPIVAPEHFLTNPWTVL